MYSFGKYINGTDPDNAIEAYNYMCGLQDNGSVRVNPVTGEPTRFMLTGDPVAGTGWLDSNPTDRRMMASFGPIDFLPGDTQQVYFKLAVGQGTDRLSSITVLRQVLAYDSIPTGVDDDGTTVLPDEFSVAQNYPNPFNPATTISYSLSERAEVEIAIFNVLGQRVATLTEGLQSAGEHMVVWNGIDESGRVVATGVYFYRISAGENVSTKKMLLLK